MDIQGTWSRDFSALLNSIWAPFYPTKEVSPKDLISQSFVIKKDVYYCLGGLFNSIEFYRGWSGGGEDILGCCKNTLPGPHINRQKRFREIVRVCKYIRENSVFSNYFTSGK